jgi:hypothetical protein
VANLIRVYNTIIIQIPGNTNLEEDLAYELQGVKMSEKHQNKPDDVTALTYSASSAHRCRERHGGAVYGHQAVDRSLGCPYQ